MPSLESGSSGVSPGVATPRRLRIFISSPGDLTEERIVCEEVIRELIPEFLHQAVLEPILWEELPLTAERAFQDQIPLPGECEIVILMLWSRLGSRLHSRFAEQGEGEAPTATLFEFRSALDARRSRQLPDLLVYRKTSAPPTVSLTDSVGFQRASQEFRKVEQFFNSTFLDQKEGVFTGSYHQFKDRLDFRPKLKQHLRILIQNQIRLASEEESPGATEWPWNIADRGSPFRGLQYFDLDHASVFFGCRCSQVCSSDNDDCGEISISSTHHCSPIECEE